MNDKTSEIERVVLGSILATGRLTCTTKLNPYVFQDPRHQAIFQAMVEVVESGQEIVVKNIQDKLRQRGIDTGLDYVERLKHYKLEGFDIQK